MQKILLTEESKYLKYFKYPLSPTDELEDRNFEGLLLKGNHELIIMNIHENNIHTLHCTKYEVFHQGFLQ